jgi:hypothetical protein
MTQSDERIDALIEAFLDFLDGVGDEPSLDHLDDDERARAERLIASLRAGRGIDPYASRPSIERLLADTEFEPVLRAGAVDASADRDLLDDVRRQITVYTSYPVSVWHDADAAAIGIKSDLVALVAANRLRIQFRSDLRGPGDLSGLDPSAVAGPIYGAFPDTAGVIVVFPDDDLSSIAIDPFDTEYCIQTPGGTLERPSTHRPILALADTVRSYVDELVPQLETNVGFDMHAAEQIDPLRVARAAATAAIEATVRDGTRAKIDAKRSTWSALGPAEVGVIADIVSDAMQGSIDAGTLAARVDELTDAA